MSPTRARPKPLLAAGSPRAWKQAEAINRPAVSVVPPGHRISPRTSVRGAKIPLNKPHDWQSMTNALRAAGKNRIDQIGAITHGLTRALEHLLAIEPEEMIKSHSQ